MEERTANKTATNRYCLLPGLYELNLSLLFVYSQWVTVTGQLQYVRKVSQVRLALRIMRIRDTSPVRGSCTTKGEQLASVTPQLARWRSVNHNCRKRSIC